MEIEVQPFDPVMATREEWSRFHTLRRLRHEETDPGDPLIGDAAFEALLKRPDPMGESFRFTVVEAGKPEPLIGWFEFEIFKEDSPSYKGNEHLARVAMALLPQYRRQGIGRVLLAKAVELAKEHGKSSLVEFSAEADGKAFARALGAKIALESLENRLPLDQVDWGMVEAWAEEGPDRSPETTLTWHRNRIEDTILEDYCRFYTEVANQAPIGDLDFEGMVFDPETFRDREARNADIGGTWITAVTTEADGDISGMTEMTHQPDRKTFIQQGLTGVKEKYRGRGLGKWLKAAMLLRVRKEFPQVKVISTGNATMNEAMLSINRRLGFRRHKEVEAFQISLETVEQYLENRGA